MNSMIGILPLRLVVSNATRRASMSRGVYRSLVMRSVDQPVGLRGIAGMGGKLDVEREGGNVDVEAPPRPRLHLIGPDHEAGRRRERDARGIFEVLARRQGRLLADDAFA